MIEALRNGWQTAGFIVSDVAKIVPIIPVVGWTVWGLVGLWLMFAAIIKRRSSD
jgi:hypothetical protein